MWILPLQKTCNFICILNSNCHQVKPWSQRRSAKARDPQVPCSWGPRHPRFAPPATPPPPGASPPPRGRCQLRSATESGLGQPMRQRRFSLNVEERVTTETGIERSSPHGHPLAAARMHHIKCASGHLPLQSSVPSCWSRCLLQGLFRCMFDLYW